VKQAPDFMISPEDKATLVRWRRGVAVFYGSIALFVAAALVLDHFARVAVAVAGR
jgi:hypothetical protein